MPPTPQPFLDDRKSLACVHCGLCLSACPTYLESGNENDSPRGRIYLMRALHLGRVPLSAEAVSHIDLCLGCRACEVACPSGVQYGELIEAAREHVEQNFARSTFQKLVRRLLVEKIFPHPTRLKLAMLPAKAIRALRAESLLPKFFRDTLSLLPSAGREAHLPGFTPASRISQRSDDPTIQRLNDSTLQPSPASTFQRFNNSTIPPRLGFIRGCVMNVLFGPTNEASVSLLAASGCDVITPASQGCCGALYAHGGNLEEARACARRNIDVFEASNVDAIIINAAGCGSTLKEYGHLLHDDPQYAERAQRFSAKVKDLTEWLAASPPARTPSPMPTGAKITYHDACHLAHAQRITREPRDLIKAVAGSQFVDLPESDVCCGSAGSYNLTEPAMAERLQRRKVENILRTGADVVVTTNPGCMLQIQAGLKKAGASHIQVLHIADFLSSRPNECP